MAAHFPADVEIFAMICAKNLNREYWRENPDQLKYARDKLAKTWVHKNEVDLFYGTVEDPSIVRTMMDLEQHLGREIIWVRGIDYGKLITQRRYIPNKTVRVCTQELKIRPIVEYLWMRDLIPCRMRVGFRYDEQERSWDMNNSFDLIRVANFRKTVTGKKQWLHEHEIIEFREPEHPLIKSQVRKVHVNEYWEGRQVNFAQDSNCQICPLKRAQQLRHNFDRHPDILQWAHMHEQIRDARWMTEISMKGIMQSGKQLDFFDGNGVGCTGGFCTS
ncbi:MAG TPA: hypothetical protein DCE41_04655 [Cytophagales bacterium]|nr:hypothetical protein [Cytophagales bacterium]